VLDKPQVPPRTLDGRIPQSQEVASLQSSQLIHLRGLSDVTKGPGLDDGLALARSELLLTALCFREVTSGPALTRYKPRLFLQWYPTVARGLQYRDPV
jgi:hypothetical protein